MSLAHSAASASKSRFEPVADDIDSDGNIDPQAFATLFTVSRDALRMLKVCLWQSDWMSFHEDGSQRGYKRETNALLQNYELAKMEDDKVTL